jgi:enoyl-CoA hydratase/carnithine racemase
VGYLHFAFYNGVMSTNQCQRLREAFLLVRQRPTKVLVLMGGTDFWSNGINLNIIEATVDPAYESWRNIHAINDLVRDIIMTDSRLVISALQGNAAARGVMLALAAGPPGIVTAERVEPGAVVFDVGINTLPDGGMVDDVDFPSVCEVAGAITPVPAVVGPLTNVMLLKQCVQAGEKRDVKSAT